MEEMMEDVSHRQTMPLEAGKNNNSFCLNPEEGSWVEPVAATRVLYDEIYLCHGGVKVCISPSSVYSTLHRLWMTVF